jgi:HlyD family secretion protein
MNEKINGTGLQEIVVPEKETRYRVNMRSELTQEILSHQPSFVEKYALYIFLCILLVFFAVSWFIKYPDIMQTRASLTAINGPKEIITREGGQLVKLLVHNGDLLHKNQAIGWLESTADHQEVIELGNQLDSSIKLLGTGELEKVSGLFITHYNNLGSIQQNYQQFIASWQLFNDYMVNGFYLRKRQLLQNDIKTLQNVRQTIAIQQELNEQELKNAEESFKMSKTLAEDKILSQEEFRQASSKLVGKQLAVQQVNAALLSNETERNDKLKQMEQIEHDLSQQKMTFQQALTSLKSLVDEWKMKYIIWAPIDGQAFFTIPLQESKFITQGKLLGYVVPRDSHYYIDADLPQNNFGKIDTGLSVQIRFDAYPYQEMGYVEGTLNYVSNVASDTGGFLATIRLNNGLVTNTHKVIPYKSGLKADAVIITRNMGLLPRLYYNFIKMSSVGNK